MKEGESRAFWAWRVGCGVCSHVPPLVSKEEPYGGSSGRWAGPRLGVMRPRCFFSCGQGLVSPRGGIPPVQ